MADFGESFLERNWGWAVTIFLYALYLWLALVVWKRHGDDLMLTAASIVVTSALWLALLLMMWRQSRRKSAYAQAAMLSHFASQAKDLANILEGVWHHWNAAGEAMTHPAGGKSEMKNWSAALAYERRDFIVLYSNHLMWLRTEVPTFISAAIQHGCPSDAEYSDVLADLREHARLLERTAVSVWKSGRKLR